MSLVTLNSLGVTLGAPLFQKLDLTISPGDRLAIVAANGRGKSTLLNILAGKLEPGEGAITRARSLTLSYMEQDPPPHLMNLSLREAVAEALAPDIRDYESWRAEIVLDEIGVPEALRDRPMQHQSGGWQRLAMIARLALADADLMLLDEPTNHLDLAKIVLLERWLNALPAGKAVVIASHDRAFLDRVTGRTLFLRLQESRLYALPYSQARRALEEEDLARGRKFDKDMKMVDQLRRQAAKLNNIAVNSGSDLLTVKTKQLKERAERIESEAEAAHRERSAGLVALGGAEAQARVLIRIAPFEERLPDGSLLFRSGPLFVCRGDRIVLLGENGAGKSRLMERLQRAIAAEGAADPAIQPTPSLKPGYMDQALAMLKTARTPLGALAARIPLGEQRARSLLAGAGIAIEKQEKPLDRLSGGQRARLALLMLRLTEANFLLLDEPTNHLDIEGQEALSQELAEEGRAAFVVSHDRAFVRAAANRFWLISGRKLTEVEGPDAFFDSLGA
ncbi:ABC-F family ATP-binding cassette domain-containing protein [Gellertiella hungarica]|uniref:ATPase subunit of ABC transporter with duplicated ATPase domains n=1 Tax=Gellertiella hungarica TaxID=1572859 RepID=A0A7W6J1X2_9HYPH|nr:ABC-F family ATP-binding cassette domain-containing protein [Gellertiella hungarica]MBB4063284.1 ATPase subunit of ABC transporter with duplicated ATPase domains [Gellertiella hungarica]